jgi:hypothetical protein
VYLLSVVWSLYLCGNVKSMKKMVRQTSPQLSLWWMVAQKGLKAMLGLFFQGWLRVSIALFGCFPLKSRFHSAL